MEWNGGKNNVKETQVLAFYSSEDMANYMDQRPHDDMATGRGNSKITRTPPLYKKEFKHLIYPRKRRDRRHEEHLPYERVIELFRLAWRALKPGGVIVVTTPNVRGLYTHLESFYLHFGHVSFYHPELLCFFLKQSGFSNWEWGENPETAAPLWGCPTETSVVSFDRELPSRWPGMRGRLVHRLKRFLTTWLILPYLDQMVPQINRQLLQLGQVMKRLDRPVECYATAIKAPAGIASSAPQQAHQD